jgi:hypothetical protein
MFFSEMPVILNPSSREKAPWETGRNGQKQTSFFSFFFLSLENRPCRKARPVFSVSATF